MNEKDIANLAKTKGKTAGKGSKPRSYNKTKFDANYDQINWKRNIKWQNFCNDIIKK